MNRLTWMMFLGAIGCSLVLGGCTEDAPVPQVSSPKVAAQAVAPKEKPKEAALPEETTKTYIYDPTGQRDPFQSFIELKQSATVDEAPQTPLQQYDLNQFRMIGIIFGKGQPVAMVVAPDGKSYILKKGVKIGKNHGVVTHVMIDMVVVEEIFKDFTGETRKNNFEIKLPKREGV